MQPTQKSLGLNSLFNKLADRENNITNNKCVKPPFGCGKDIDPENFKDEKSIREYQISGLCQECQDSIFG